MRKGKKFAWIIMGAILAGLGLEWFIKASHVEATTSRNAMAVMQIVIGLFAVIYAFLKKPKPTR